MNDDVVFGRAGPDAACAGTEASDNVAAPGREDNAGAAALVWPLLIAFARIVSPYCLRRVALETAVPVLGKDAVGVALAAALRASAFC